MSTFFHYHTKTGTTVHVILVRRQGQDDRSKRKNSVLLSSPPQEMNQKIRLHRIASREYDTDCIYLFQGNSAWLQQLLGRERVLLKLSRMRILPYRRGEGVCGGGVLCSTGKIPN